MSHTETPESGIPSLSSLRKRALSRPSVAPPLFPGLRLRGMASGVYPRLDRFVSSLFPA